MRKSLRRVWPLLVLVALLLSGCAVTGADEFYTLPRRSSTYLELQRAIDSTMTDKGYAAPVSGNNRRAIQTADLDGDGVDEVLVFARARTGEKPLKVHVFQQENDAYSLLCTIENDGAAFDSVQYVQIDGAPGMEIVLSCRLTGQILQALNVYRLQGERMDELLHAGCTAYTVTELNGDGLSDVITLSYVADRTNGIASYFRWRESEMLRSGEADISGSPESVKRIITGNVAENVPAVFVASAYDENNIVTDVFVAPADGVFSNVSLTDANDLSTSTVRSYYVYSTDIDGDGVIELPQTKTLSAISSDPASRDQSCIIWYNLRPDGTHEDKLTTYHNYDEGWYLVMDDDWRTTMSVTKRTDETLGQYTCFLLSDYVSRYEFLRVYVLSGATATEALESGSVILLSRRGDTYYCAALGKDVQMEAGELQERFGFISTDTLPQ